MLRYPMYKGSIPSPSVQCFLLKDVFGALKGPQIHRGLWEYEGSIHIKYFKALSWALLHLMRFFKPLLQATKSPAVLLERLCKLSEAVNRDTTKAGKEAILRQYPDCHCVMARIYDPHARHFISSKTMLAYMKQAKELPPPPKSLPELLDTLSSRQLTGHAALAAAASFYCAYCNTEALQTMFCRVLDRNLKIGVSTQTLNRAIFTDKAPIPGVALASTLHPGTEASLWTKYPYREWYASRKLDGVRCLAIVTSDSVGFYSRTGRAFYTLQKVQDDIERRLVTAKLPFASFVLDGEICVYKQGQDPPMEDFKMALRQIRRQQEPMPNPVFHVFDLIDLDTFLKGKGDTVFTERQGRLIDFIGEKQPHLAVVDQRKVNSVEHLLCMKAEAIEHGWEGLILRSNSPYEGKRRYLGNSMFALLCSDLPVHSRNMLKIKEWQDAEYIVKSIETGCMRLPSTGQDTQVMASVLIEHKGNPVSVGSGFTFDQRIKYAKHPELIIGKPITVQYFAESTNEDGVLSLRFPTVKTVYEEGKRDI